MGRASRRKKEKKRGRKKDEPYDGMVILNLPGNALELAYPVDWSFDLDPRGYLRFEDPVENMALELSTLELPPGPLPADMPTPAEQLRLTLSDKTREHDGDDGVRAYHQEPDEIVIHQRQHFDNDMAWCDFTYDVPDSSRDQRVRLNHGRHMIASNLRVQTYWTYYYWDDHAEEAVYWWNRMVNTLHIGQPGQPTGTFEAIARRGH